jgi:hypothetical protein
MPPARSLRVLDWTSEASTRRPPRRIWHQCQPLRERHAVIEGSLAVDLPALHLGGVTPLLPPRVSLSGGSISLWKRRRRRVRATGSTNTTFRSATIRATVGLLLVMHRERPSRPRNRVSSARLDTGHTGLSTFWLVLHQLIQIVRDAGLPTSLEDRFASVMRTAPVFRRF